VTQERVFYVKAEWDEEAKVWYVSGSDVPGLNAEANTPQEMVEILQSLIPELLEANGVLVDNVMPDVPYSVMFDQLRADRIGC